LPLLLFVSANYWYATQSEQIGERFARRMRREPTRGERLLWWALRSSKVGHRFPRQHPIGRYILDFFCVKGRLCVEVDGATHDDPAAQAYDEARTRFLEKQRIRVMRFTHEDVVNNLAGVVAAIEQELSQ
jgi:very-short-patch-repair endonuclease